MMKKIKNLSLFCCFILSLTGCFESEVDIKAKGLIYAVKETLKDPDSAIFKDVVMGNNKLCGTVSGKNSFGGRTGFKRFISNGERFGTIYEDTARDSNKFIEQFVGCCGWECYLVEVSKNGSVNTEKISSSDWLSIINKW